MKWILVMMMFAGAAQGQVSDCIKDSSKCIITDATQLIRLPRGCFGGWSSYVPDGKGLCVLHIYVVPFASEKLTCKLTRASDVHHLTCSYPDPDFKKPTKE